MSPGAAVIDLQQPADLFMAASAERFVHFHRRTTPEQGDEK
jgi:hypothetical protein